MNIDTKRMNYKKRYNEAGQVAVLVSPNFGAGWSTWSHEPAFTEAMVFDSRLVDAVLAETNNKEFEILCGRLGYTDIYLGGTDDLTVVWLDEGTRFVIEEYDGSESIRTFDDLVYTA